MYLRITKVACLQKYRKEQMNMNEAKTKYNKKCKSRIVTFYLHERELWEYSKRINFQKRIKDILKEDILKDVIKKGGDK